jgi:hypothetical protein
LNRPVQRSSHLIEIVVIGVVLIALQGGRLDGNRGVIGPYSVRDLDECAYGLPVSVEYLELGERRIGSGPRCGAAGTAGAAGAAAGAAGGGSVVKPGIAASDRCTLARLKDKNAPGSVCHMTFFPSAVILTGMSCDSSSDLTFAMPW